MIVNSMTQPLMFETVWFDKCKYDEAEKKFEEEAAEQRKCKRAVKPVVRFEMPKSSISEEIAIARQQILKTLQSEEPSLKYLGVNNEYKKYDDKMKQLESENEVLKNTMQRIQDTIRGVLERVVYVEEKIETLEQPSKETEDVKEENPVNSVVNNHTDDGAAAADDDDNIDLFGSDEEEDAAAIQLREERLKAYENKKSKKAPLVAKSSVVLDIKPWDDETDMKEMEVNVRQIQCEGLKWGASKLVPLAYGIKKLQIVCVVEDDKVSIDWLQETIQDSVDDLVQSVDIAAFNKL